MRCASRRIVEKRVSSPFTVRHDMAHVYDCKPNATLLTGSRRLEIFPCADRNAGPRPDTAAIISAMPTHGAPHEDTRRVNRRAALGIWTSGLVGLTTACNDRAFSEIDSPDGKILQLQKDDLLV